MFGILDYLKLGAGVAAGLMLYHLYAISIGYPSAAREARAGYVLLAEKTAADARAAEMERQASANKIVADAYQVQYRNQLQKDELVDAQAEQERKAHAADNLAKGRDDGLDDSDIQFLLRKRP
jgi:hypothetical protein